MKNFRSSFKIILVAGLFSAAIFLVSHSALAAAISTNELFGGTNGANFASTAGLANVSLVLLIANIIRAALGFVGVVAVCFVIYAGFLWTTAGGEEEKIKKAKQVMKNALIGLVIILSSFAIAQFFISRITTAMGATNIEQPCTGPDCGCTGLHCEDCGGSSCDLETTFVLQPLDLACAATIQNYQPRFVFSQRVIKTEIVENGMISIKKAGVGGAPDVEVEGTFSAIGGISSSAQSFIFSPKATCLNNPDFFCFDAGGTYNVTVSESLQSSNGYDIECDDPLFPTCTFSFTVGSEIDIEPPVINMTDPGEGESFIVGSLGHLQAGAEDDIGVSAVSFWVDEDDVDSDSSGTVSSIDPDVYYFDGWWDTTGNITNHEYTITADGSDCAGNSDSDSVDVVLSALNCDNDVQDGQDGGEPEFETGTCEVPANCDCGGVDEYYCRECIGAACYENSDCRSGNCENGICASTIEITSISPGDGAVGNLITIYGSGFGGPTTPGLVTFLGVNGQGVMINSNSACASWWQDDQVVVQVPVGAPSGPIRITNSVSGKYDQTNDDNGSVISDFVVNTTVRPGICSISPDTGFGRDSVTVSGKNFGSERGIVNPADLYFGIYEATNYSSWSAAAIAATTPALNNGTYNVQFFSGAVGSRQGSNTVTFRVDTNPTVQPPVITGVDSGLMGCSNSSTTSACEIDSDCSVASCVTAEATTGQCANDSNIACTLDSECSDSTCAFSTTTSGQCSSDSTRSCTVDTDCGVPACDLEAGPIGQYVTIYGSNFGTTQGTVRFQNQSTEYEGLGDNHFPDVCESVYWSDDRIVIKVPALYDQTNLATPPDEYNPPVTVGLHDLWVRTANGPSSAVDFWVINGEASPGICALIPDAGPVGTTVAIYGEGFEDDAGTEAPFGKVKFYDNKEVASIPVDWEDDHILGNAAHPMLVPAGAETGPVFIVDRDEQESNSVNFQVGMCDADFTCPASQECCESGACLPTTMGCGGTVAFAAHYAYRFSTGDIPHNPAIKVECSEPNVSPRIVSPSPYEGWRGGNDVCPEAVLHVVFTEPMNRSTFTNRTATFPNGTILVEECNDADCTNPTAITMVSESTSSDSFTWGPNPTSAGSGWTAGKRYKVTVMGGTTGVLSARGLGMLQNYTWYFETSASGESCSVGGVLVDPAEYTADSICSDNTTCANAISYSAAPISDEYECTVLACSGTGYDWTFSSGVPDEAGVTPKPNASDCEALAFPHQETSVGSPVHVIADLLYGVGLHSTNYGELTINFSDPQVDNYWPRCSEACLNAEIGLTFNLAMKIDTFGNNRVKLFKCQDEACAPDEVTDVTITQGISPVYTGDTVNGIYKLIIGYTSDLTANTSYRVTISDDAESDSGSTLAEAVGDMAWYNGDLTWTFTTGDATCEVDRVGVEPSSATLQRIGDVQRFTVVPFGTADDCSDEGQRLTAADFNWEAWTATDVNGLSAGTVAALFGYSGANTLNVASSLPAGCSSLCLNTGSPAPVAICGNNAVYDCDTDSDCGGGEKCNINKGQCVEPGEDCDDGNLNSNDGCSSRCLNEGSTSSTCGNGIVNTGEDCDFGAYVDSSSTNHPALASASHPGCSATCLSVGASSVGATCGNGNVAYSRQAGGEECDFGDENSANNCSSNCLNLGSESRINYPAICGDGILGDGDSDTTSSNEGEECDDRNTVNGDGCSSTCLHEGSSSVYGSSCGGTSGTQTGEDCDDGNSVNGDGCSSVCLSEGSSDARRAVCGNGVRETGEECEVLTTPTRIAPFVLAYISSTAQLEVEVQPANAQGIHSASSKITAKEDVSNKTGDGYLTLQCACTTDASCNSGTANSYGCGNSSCCFPRPEVSGRYPEISATNVCRNTAVWVNFNQPMDVEAVKNSGTLYLKLNKINCTDASCTAGDTVDDSTECPESYTSVPLALENNEDENLLVRAWHWVRDNILQIFGAQATTISACLVPVNYTLITPTKIGLDLSEALVANAEYNLFIMGESNLTTGHTSGVMSTGGVDLLSGESNRFVTGANICTLDYVSVIDNGIIGADVYEDPSPGFFSATGERHTLTAAGYTLNGAVASQIQSIAGVYSWAWGAWSSTEASNETIMNIPAETGTGTTIATSETQDGTVQAVISANITSDTLGGTVNTSVTGEAELTTFLCSNPWPDTRRAGGSYRFEDTSSSAADFGLSTTGNFTNFAFSYCRDQAGSTDLLPSLTMREVTSVASTTIFKELLFLANNDAIGVRVLPNPNYLTPADWFADQGFTGSPSETTVDGYEAVQDGNTYYVSAVNSNASTTSSTKILYPNIYVISYNEGASDEMENIFSQVLDSWTFNANDSVITDINVCKDSVTVTSATEETVFGEDGEPISCFHNDECTEGAGEPFCSTTENICKTQGVPAVSTSVNYVYGEDENLVSCDWDGDCQGVTQSDGTVTDDSAFCNGEKAKLTRDLKRLTDSRKIASIIGDYGEANSYCSVTSNQFCEVSTDCPGTETCQHHVPPLVSGTFLSSFTTSTWPSWASELDNALGTTLPVDPINEFVGCHAGADENYCWDSVAGEFTCHEGSHAYLYQNLGGVAYKLGVQLEGSDVIGTWGYSLDDDSADNATLYAEYAYTSSSAESALTNPVTSGGFYTTGPMCSNVTMGTSSSRCGDGVKATDNILTTTVNEAEVCEIGEYESRPCTYIYPDLSTATGTQNFGCIETTVNSVSVCAWQTTATSACVPYSCGNGVLEGTEVCDDGEENGTYGHCGQSCNFVGSFSCGDGFIAGGEECDCYSTTNWLSTYPNAFPVASWAYVNSCDAANGQYDATYDDTCAFDCTFPGPSCGDGELNGPEECDGEDTESWSGSLCSAGTNTGEACTVNDDCGTGGLCGNAQGHNACTISQVCADGSPCSTTDPVVRCASGNGTCSSAEYQLTRTRTCDDAPGATCTWHPWTPACSGGDQVCGNGILEGDEECDDGNDDSTDDCTSECTVSVCGDDYVYAGHETCDNGNENGDVCSPEYDDTCSYCNINCQYTTVSGAYCGDATIQTGEFCDTTNITKYCFKANVIPGLRDIGPACTLTANCTGAYADYTCETVGACNGGNTFNAAPCAVGSTGSCGSGGNCVAPDCSNTCDATCPTTYDSTSVLIQTELAGASKESSADLYSYGNTSGLSPDLATLFIPACEVGTAITADIDMSGVITPTTAVVFVTDLSGSMESDISGVSGAAVGNRRIDYAAASLAEAIDTLFDAYGTSTDIQIATVSFTSFLTDGVDTDGDSTIEISDSCNNDGLAWIDQPLTDFNDKYDLLYDPERGVQSYPDRAGGYTPTAAGLICARRILAESDADYKFVVLFSDGAPTVTLSGTISSSATSTTLSEAVNAVHGVYNSLDTLSPPAKTYTAALTDDSDLIGYMAHFSSDICGSYDSDVDGDCSVTSDTCSSNSGCRTYCENDPTIECSTSTDYECNVGATGWCEWNLASNMQAECGGDILYNDAETGEEDVLICPKQATTCPFPFGDSRCNNTYYEEGTCVFTGEVNECLDDQVCNIPTAPISLASDCGPDDFIEYAYTAATATDLTAMYDEIIQDILGIHVGFITEVNGSTTVTRGVISEGDGVELPFPEGFSCDDSTESSIPLKINFGGTGAINISNINLNYCPAR